MSLLERPAFDPETQRREALLAANQKRSGRRFYRECVIDGRIDVRDLIREPPEELHGMTVLAVMTMPYAKKRSASGPWKEKLGKSALRADINLLMPIERASTRTREWAAENVTSVSVLAGKRRS